MKEGWKEDKWHDNKLYKIIRFYRKSGRRKVIKRGLTREEAQQHCGYSWTHKIDSKGNVVWFDGFEEM